MTKEDIRTIRLAADGGYFGSSASNVILELNAEIERLERALDRAQSLKKPTPAKKCAGCTKKGETK